MGALRRLRGSEDRQEVDPRLLPMKLRMIDVACTRTGARSLADLGGIWAVDGGYSFYAADRHGLDRVVIVDDDFTPASEAAAADRDGRVELVRGNFGAGETAARVGEVDALILFDVLLHQVRPDWDEVLELWAPRAQAFILSGPWWAGDATTRLVDLPREEYLAAIPPNEVHDFAVDRLDELNERRGRPWRDVHDIWQWGITEPDLRRKLDELGFVCAHAENQGSWMGLDRFDDIGFVFCRPEAIGSTRRRVG